MGETSSEDYSDVVRNAVRENLVITLVILSWTFSLWELYLNLRQRRLMQKLTKPPSVLDNILTEEVYEKSRVYALDRNTFGNVQELYGNIFNTIYMIGWGYRYCWIWGEELLVSCGLDPKNEFYATAGCLVVMTIISTFLRDLPFKIYNTFVLEQKYDFNKETPLFFIKDQILKFFISMALMIPLTMAMVWIVKNGGDYFFIYMWVFAIVMSLLLMIIYPEVIAPLFDKYTPLPDGDLRKRIEALAASVNYPLYKLFIVEGSRRSSHSNAYLYGFFKHKRIVLFDTLISDYKKIKEEAEKEKQETENQNNEKAESEEELKSEKEMKHEEETHGEGEKKSENESTNNEKVEDKKETRGCDTDEIVAVLAHELGHWHYSHALQGFFFAQIMLLANFVLFAQFLHYKPIYEAFGFYDSQPVLIGLFIVTSHMLEPINKFIGWGMTIMTRRYEFQADAYAQKLGYAEYLKTALIKLQKDNLGYPLYDKLYSNWYHSHPPLLERLDALKKDD